MILFFFENFSLLYMWHLAVNENNSNFPGCDLMQKTQLNLNTSDGQKARKLKKKRLVKNLKY